MVLAFAFGLLLRAFAFGMVLAFALGLSVTGFRCTDFFSEKIIVGPWEVPHPPFLEEIIVTH